MSRARWAAVLACLVATIQASSPSPKAGAVPGAEVCFAPGTGPAVIQNVYQKLYGSRQDPPLQLFQFQDGNRWDSTATNPGPLSQGDPTTIRWSIVPDGTLIPGSSIGEPTSPSVLIANFNAIYGNQATWRALIQQSFDRWGQLTGITYVFEPNDDGAFFPDSPGVINVRGDVRIAGHPIDGNFNILGYNFFPNFGDMVIDVPDSFYSNTSSNSLRLRNTVAHEHGHGLGFDHVCPVDQTKVMEPILSLAFDGPQHDDTLAGQRGYGDDKETNDTLGAATDFGSLVNGTVSVNGVSADDNSDVDRYKFTVAAGKKVNVTVTPVGFTYAQGPQNMGGSCSGGTSFNSLILNDVGFEVIGTNGTTVLATANSQPAGTAESLTDVVLGSAGTYSLRVFAGASNQVQLYNLSLTVADASANLAITKTDGRTTVLAGSLTTYSIVVSNAGPGVASGATVVDSFPAAISSVSWTCTASAGSSCGTASGTGNINRTVNLGVGGTATFTAVATLSASATGMLSNTATVSPPAGIVDPVPGNNSATDTDTIVPIANLSITKTDGQATAAPGGMVTYTIVASNAGPNAATGATVTDTVPAALTGVSWTCVGAGGGTCPANGSGNINASVNLPVGGSVTFTLGGTVAASPSGLINTATVSVPAGMADPNLSNNSATDEDLLLCFGEQVVVADGRVTQNLIGASATTWFLSRLRSGSSYSLEFKNTTGGSSVPGTLTVFSGADGCSGTSTVTVRDTSGIEPVGGLASRRVSFTAGSPGSYFRARLVNGTGSAISYSVSWSETALFSATWSTNGSFNTFYSFQNTTGASVSGTLTLLDTAGVVVSSFPVMVPVGQTTSVNTQGLGVARNKVGTARFSHNGPPGAILAEAAVANFSLSPAYIQPVRFQAVREAR